MISNVGTVLVLSTFIHRRLKIPNGVEHFDLGCRRRAASRRRDLRSPRERQGTDAESTVKTSAEKLLVYLEREEFF